MIYFINEYLLAKNSSVEHAAIKRVQLFTKFKQPAQIITKTYDRLLARTLATFELAPEQVLNMYDYFQKMPKDIQTCHIEDLDLPVEYEISTGANFSRVYNGDQLVSRVGFIPGTIGRLFYQEFLDNQGNLMSTDLWDWRGLKSSTQYFGQNGQLILQRYYQPNGQTVLEEFYVADVKGRPLLARVILKNYQGRAERFFKNRDDLFAFFLAELSRQDPAVTTFISDRPGTGVQPLLELQDDSRKYINVPIYHAKDINEPLQSAVDGFLQPAFDNPQHFNGFITATTAQAQHLRRRLATKAVFNLPIVTVKPKSQERLVPITTRPKQLLYVGRLSADRQLDQLLRVIALVKGQLPTIQCDLYGYGDPADVEKLRTLTKKLDLEQQVHFLDYQPDLPANYDDYQLLVNTALANGGPLAMPEAMGHGIPVVSYNFNYGPTDFIADDGDGYIIPQGNQLLMSQKIVELLTDDQKLTAFSLAAYDKLHAKQTQTMVWHQWQKQLDL